MSIHGEIFDITIIGSGPVGLYGSIYAASRQKRVKVIESQSFPGGRLSAHYPDKTIYDVAGHPAIVAQDLVDRLYEQSKGFDVEFFFDERVERLTFDDEIWSLHTPKGVHRTKSVVISAGVAAFLPSKLELPGKEQLEGHGIYYNIENPERFRNQKVVIVGTGDHALQWAMELSNVADKVTLVHRLGRLKTPGDYSETGPVNVELKFPYFELKEIHGEDKLKSVTILDTSSGQELELDADALVLNIGFLANLNKFKDWGLTVDANSIHVNERMSTSLPGVFAAGDIVTHPGKLKLISTGSGEAAIAVGSAIKWLEDKAIEDKRKAAGTPRALEQGSLFFSGFESVQIAIHLEEQAKQFYSAAFERTGNKAVKELFAKMQRNKLDNVDYLREKALPLFTSGEYAQEDLDGTAAAYLISVADQQLFAGHNLAKEAMNNLGSDLQNIYTGIQVEEDIKAFHQRLAGEQKMASGESHFSHISSKAAEEIKLLRSAQSSLMEAGLVE